MASTDGNNLVVFYYLSASERWPDKKGDLFGGSGFMRCYMSYLDVYLSSSKVPETLTLDLSVSPVTS